MFDASFLVVLYNKSIKGSDTINSIIDNFEGSHNIAVTIWNNGPNSIANEFFSLKDDFLDKINIEFSLVESLDNSSLSKVYNQFVCKNDSKRYVILDDDSILSKSYLKSVTKVEVDNFGFPLIFSNDKVCNPKVKGRPLGNPGMQVIDKNFMTIGSGIVIGSDMIKLLESKYLKCFDERFFFYGVDSTFIKRVIDLNPKKKSHILPRIEHSISINVSENKGVTRFRKRERSYDVGLQFKYYYKSPGKYFYLVLLIVKNLISNSRVYNSIDIIKAFVSGKHYRDKL